MSLCAAAATARRATHVVDVRMRGMMVVVVVGLVDTILRLGRCPLSLELAFSDRRRRKASPSNPPKPNHHHRHDAHTPIPIPTTTTTMTGARAARKDQSQRRSWVDSSSFASTPPYHPSPPPPPPKQAMRRPPPAAPTRLLPLLLLLALLPLLHSNPLPDFALEDDEFADYSASLHNPPPPSSSSSSPRLYVYEFCMLNLLLLYLLTYLLGRRENERIKRVFIKEFAGLFRQQFAYVGPGCVGGEKEEEEKEENGEDEERLMYKVSQSKRIRVDEQPTHPPTQNTQGLALLLPPVGLGPAARPTRPGSYLGPREKTGPHHQAMEELLPLRGR